MLTHRSGEGREKTRETEFVVGPHTTFLSCLGEKLCKYSFELRIAINNLAIFALQSYSEFICY